MPALTGRTTQEAFELLRNAGFAGGPALVQSRYVANDSVPPGTIAAQDIAAGTSVRLTTPIPIEVSAGGPAIDPSDLQRQALTHLQGLAGFNLAEPVLVFTTPSGDAYKVDKWLFGPCPSVTASYRTFSDPEYGDSCY